MKGVIPAAGLGTRFLPATKNMPKEMLPVVENPAIQYAIEEAVSAGVDDILIITGRGKEAIENHFDVAYDIRVLPRHRAAAHWIGIPKDNYHKEYFGVTKWELKRFGLV